MCASYGLGGGPHELGLTFDLPPMHEPESRELIAQWARENHSKASITGRHARNLNPLIHEGYGERTVELGWWWLHIGSEPAPFSAFNSRDDNLLAKWRDPLQRRAILPAHWYIEKGRTFAMPDDELFGIAAIVTPVSQPDGKKLMTYSMVTRASLARAADVHPRMPLLLPREAHDTWLDPARPGDRSLVTEAVRASDDFAAEVVIISDPDAGATLG
ncbi:SOS response-associated peptidase [Leucobacter coleopterorum]|uniref:Abasic site processing protein n=1 Tax=Leucobacter coleopterorum TaxID=2714933 RepID=A0ABX6JZQ2_9MICO|nr:SOS response-associated peptidase family protein [Leucobacter coleopterorum]QIM18270.1 SOS response-associated peptidase [Leucobacter coleopterorum]